MGRSHCPVTVSFLLRNLPPLIRLPLFPGPVLHACKRSSLAIITRSQGWVERGTAGPAQLGLCQAIGTVLTGYVGAGQGLTLLLALAAGLHEWLQPMAAHVFPVSAVVMRVK